MTQAQHEPDADNVRVLPGHNQGVGALNGEIDEALGLLHRGLGMLVDIGARGDLTGLGPDGLIAMARQFEAHRTRLITVDNYVIEAATEERLNEHTCTRTPAAALAQVLRISQAEANARSARAAQLLPRNGFSAGPQAPDLPVLAAAVSEGAVTVDQVRVIGTAMRRLATNSQVRSEDVETAEQALLRYAVTMGPNDLKVVAAKIDEVLLPDGAVPDAPVTAGRRGLTIGPQRRDGTHAIKGHLTPSAKALFDAAIGPLSAPLPERDGASDRRSPAQRTHDGLAGACRRLLDLAGVPASGGTAATVHITVDLDKLIEQIRRHRESGGRNVGAIPAVGQIAGGDRIGFSEFAQLAREAELVPVWASSTRGIVAYGRDRRIATSGQTNALIARDAGCSFPGCMAPPDWCQRHHVTPWWDGGMTNLDNLTLVCGHHHREFERSGWSVQIVDGLPWWSPPAWQDPDRTPLLNTRIRIPDDAEIERVAARVRPPLQRSGSGSPGDQLDKLLDQLTAHIGDEEGEEFRYELDLLVDSYVGPNAPSATAA